MRSLLALALAATTAVVLTRDTNANTAAPQRVAAESLPSPARPGSAEPNLTVDDNGRVYMSWLEPADSGHALRFASLDGQRWSEVRTIVSRRDFFVNWADFPSIEALGGNRFVAHWLQRNGTGTYAYGVRLSQSADGGRTWSVPVTPHRDSSPAEHGFVALWRERNGVGAAWLDGRKFSKGSHDASNEMMLMSTSLSPDGKMDAEARLDERACDCCQTAAAMTSNGPVVVYRDRSPQEIRDIYITRRVGMTWTPGAAVHADNWKIAACPVNGPAVAARDNRVVVAWFTGANDSARVKIAFSDDAGAKFSAPVRVDGGNPAGRVDVELLADGNALVTWIERTRGDTAAVQARRVTRSGTAGPVVTVASSSAARASGFPRTALTKDHAVFAWTQPGRPSAIRVARLPLASIR